MHVDHVTTQAGHDSSGGMAVQ